MWLQIYRCLYQVQSLQHPSAVGQFFTRTFQIPKGVNSVTIFGGLLEISGGRKVD